MKALHTKHTIKGSVSQRDTAKVAIAPPGAFYFTGHTLYNVDKAVQEIVKAAGILHIPVEKLIVDWSLAQDRTIRDQLMEGVRYLDIRAIWDGKCTRP